MSNLREKVDFDALPYLDREFDHPAIQAAVRGLIETEMQSFRPSAAYLSHLPYPELRFTKAAMARNAMENLIKGEPSSSSSRSVSAAFTKRKLEIPSDDDVNKIEAWHEAVRQAKIAVEEEQNNQLNLQVYSEYAGPVYLAYNSALDGMALSVSNRVNDIKTEIKTMNAGRQRFQTSVADELMKSKKRRLEALHRLGEGRKACAALEQFET